jgi:hypothetical protein
LAWGLNRLTSFPTPGMQHDAPRPFPGGFRRPGALMMTDRALAPPVSNPVADEEPVPAAPSAGDFPAFPEAWAYRAWFTQAWRTYVRATFEGPAAVARAFHVDDRTARDWWHGRCGPSGAFVAMAFAVMPDRAAAHLARRSGGWWAALIASLRRSVSGPPHRAWGVLW